MREFEGCNCIETSTALYGDRGQVCPEYESWCSEVDAEEAWMALTDSDRDEIIQDGVAWALDNHIKVLQWEAECGGVPF